ncbi:MAG TPA: type II toxin-antitoxin system RelE/ParE family toxin [Thermoanaerobaculia bacterium]|nr:type II toxin-antitoxin system RelE/ParE family toxin [Thermoanaerobaculia bacterium]
MAYAIEITRRAARDLAALPVGDRKRIGRKVDALAGDPRPANARKLAGAEDLYRLRSGHYRVIYQVRDEVLVVLVIMIRHRGSVYEDLERLLRGR